MSRGRPTREGYCLGCGEHYPNVVKHHRRGFCAKCSNTEQRAKIRAATQSETIAGAAATSITSDNGQNIGNLGELLLLVHKDRFMLVHHGEQRNLYVNDNRGGWVNLSGDKNRAMLEASALSALVEETREAQATEQLDASVEQRIPKEFLSHNYDQIMKSIPNICMKATQRDVDVRRPRELNKQPNGVFLLVDGVLEWTDEKIEVHAEAETEWMMTD